MKSNLLKILFFQDSRKVGFGMWVFILSNVYYFFATPGFNVDVWMKSQLLAGGIITGGTMFDRKHAFKKDVVPQP